MSANAVISANKRWSRITESSQSAWSRGRNCRRQLAHAREQASGEGSGRSCQRFGVYTRAAVESERDGFFLRLDVGKAIRAGCEHSSAATAPVSEASPGTSPGFRGGGQFRTLTCAERELSFF